MKTIGLLGGMSWESTVTYYQIINETVKRELGLLLGQKDSPVPVFDTTLIHAESAALQALA